MRAEVETVTSGGKTKRMTSSVEEGEEGGEQWHRSSEEDGGAVCS